MRWNRGARSPSSEFVRRAALAIGAVAACASTASTASAAQTPQTARVEAVELVCHVPNNGDGNRATCTIETARSPISRPRGSAVWPAVLSRDGVRYGTGYIDVLAHATLDALLSTSRAVERGVYTLTSTQRVVGQSTVTVRFTATIS